MLTRERMESGAVGVAPSETMDPWRRPERRAELQPVPEAPPAGPGLLSRLFWASVGFGLAATGFALVLTVFLAFIGLPMFVFGLGLMQSQAR